MQSRQFDVANVRGPVPHPGSTDTRPELTLLTDYRIRTSIGVRRGGQEAVNDRGPSRLLSATADTDNRPKAWGSSADTTPADCRCYPRRVPNCRDFAVLVSAYINLPLGRDRWFRSRPLVAAL